MRYSLVKKPPPLPTKLSESGVRPKMRPTMKLTPEELDKALASFVEDEEEHTSPRLELADFWAGCMNDYPERK